MKLTLAIFVCMLTCTSLNAGEICLTTESDPDGDGFGWEQNATCLVVTKVSDTGELVSPAEAASQSIVDPRTGIKIDIQRIHWAPTDFAGKTFSGCKGYVVDPAKEKNQCLSCSPGESYQYEHYEDGNGRLFYKSKKTKIEAEFEWGVDEYGLYYGPMAIGAYAEVTNSGINQWLEGTAGAIGFYEHCAGVIPASDIQSTSATESEEQS